MESYIIYETIALPIHGDNILRMGFEPFKLRQDDPLSGLEGGQSLIGGKHFVKKDGINVKFIFANSMMGMVLTRLKLRNPLIFSIIFLIGCIQLVDRVNIAQGSLVILVNTWWGCIASPSRIMPFCVHIVLKLF